MLTVTVYVANKLLQTILCMENFFLCFAFLVWTKVAKSDADTCVEVSKLTHTACDDIPLIVCGSEDCWIWPELLASTSEIGFANHLYRIQRLSFLVFLLIDFAIAEYL